MKNICYQMSRRAWLIMLLLFSLTFPTFAQNITVTGTVMDSTGEPLIGASVLVKGETVGAATDIDGNFTIKVAPNAILQVSYVGYDTQDVAVDGRTQLTITLKEGSVMLNEVVAIGYGVVKKSDATGSVATIKPSEIEAGLATSAQDLLVGASPGVVVTTQGGDPNGGADIQIRGGASLSASNSPLIVVDGVPMNTEGVKGGSNPLSLISPDNVESMTILKDASATAIFGSRASNGVIIITTKTGKSGRPQVNFTMNGYVNTTRKYLDLMNAGEFRTFIINEYGENSDQAAALGTANTNWLKEGLRTTFSSDYSLSVGGTAGFLPYRVAVSYTDNNGIMQHTAMDRVTASVNLTPKFFDNLLSINANVKASYVKNAYADNNLASAAAMNPTIPVRDFKNGAAVFNYWSTYGGNGQLLGPDAAGTDVNSTTAPLNPIAGMIDRHSEGTAWNSVGNLQIDLKMPFLTDLRANLNLGYDYQKGKYEGYYGFNTPASWDEGYSILTSAGNPKNVKDGGTAANEERQTRTNYLLDFYLNYNHEFESIQSTLDVTAGYSWQKFKNKLNTWSVVNQVAPGNEANLGVQAFPTNIDIEPLQLISFFGRVNFTFLNKYLVTATVRRDGTSRFSKQNRWGTFPSAAIGWKLLEESFMDGVKGFMTELKIRGGYGVTGQQDIYADMFAYLPRYTINKTDLSHVYPSLNGGNSTMITITPDPYNADLKWEETRTWNAGIDFGMFNNRLTGSFDFYKRKTVDLLTQATYPAGSNLTNEGWMNIGDLENTGVEVNLTGRPIVTDDLTWTSSINVAWNKNKITRLAEGANMETGDISAGTGGKIQKHAVGHPAFSFYVFEQVYDKNGDPIDGVFVDRNGDGEITDADKYLYHSKNPKVTLTWSNTVNWKNWDFGITLRSNMGNWMYNNTQASLSIKSANAALPLSNLLKNSFLFERGGATVVRSDYFVQNASFLRCDNITVGYTWKDLFNKGLRIRLYGAVQNAFVITKYKGLDPEVFSGIDNGVYPRPITVNVGVIASF